MLLKAMQLVRTSSGRNRGHADRLAPLGCKGTSSSQNDNGVLQAKFKDGNGVHDPICDVVLGPALAAHYPEVAYKSAWNASSKTANS